MSDEASPRPWFVNGHSIEANDPDGLWLQNEKTGRGVVANLPSCPKSRMSTKNRKTWDAIVEANAALIVDAVNTLAEFEAAHMEFPDFRPVIIAAGQRDAAIAERDRLRDLVKRMIPFVEKCHSDALELSKTIKGVCALKGVDTSEIDRINSKHDALISEARAALGEDKE